MIFLVSESKKHPEVQGSVCTAPVIDLGPHAICNLSAQTSKQANKTRTILDNHPARIKAICSH
jgi:hypothetical protein